MGRCILRLRSHRCLGIATIAAVPLALSASACGVTIYVDDTAPFLGDGQSWDTAFRFLQDALTFANVPQNNVTEVRIGKGTYKPDRTQILPHGSGDRNATFALIQDVAIRGGYAGFGAANPDLRDVVQFETILSGDLLGNDLPPSPPLNLPQNVQENSIHVVSGGSVTATSVLDGVTITAGHAGPDQTLQGGGVFINAGSPRILDCTLKNNYANAGGGGGAGIAGGGSPLFDSCTFADNRTLDGCCGSGGGGAFVSVSSNPTLVNCTFHQNRFSPGSAGGAIRFSAGVPEVFNCTFTANGEVAPIAFSGSGGAIRMQGSNAVISGCTFNANRASGGGGISIAGGAPIIEDCTFIANAAEGGAGISGATSTGEIRRCTFLGNDAEAGGGIAIHGGALHIDACRFHGNLAHLFAGGALYHLNNANTLITNCEFSGNVGGGTFVPGGALHNEDSQATLVNCTIDSNSATAGGAVSSVSGAVQLDNCILRNNSPSHFAISGGTLLVNHSNVQGGWPGTGNINANPLFVRHPHPGMDGIWITSDDDYGDLRLSPNSPCLNTGNNNAIPPGVTTDLLGNPRVQGGVVDMGAYEGPHCPADIAPAPLGNAVVNASDLILVLDNWGDCPPGPCIGDVGPPGGDRIVNIQDVLATISDWGVCP